MSGCVAPVRLLTRCTARSAVGASCGCSCARSTARHVAGLISRTCDAHRRNHERRQYLVFKATRSNAIQNGGLLRHSSLTPTETRDSMHKMSLLYAQASHD